MLDNIQRTLRRITAEQVMLGIIFVLSVVFYLEPTLQDYPENAAIFPQLTAIAVLIGAALLLTRRYLPGPIRRIVTENVSIAQQIEETDDDAIPDQEVVEEETTPEDRTLGAVYGLEIDNTLFVTVTATLYLFAGWAVGLLYVTPIYVLGYTLWFRVPWQVGVGLAAFASIIIWGFIRFLLMPFDQGELVSLMVVGVL
jgi:HAMP domain-containing protein